MKICLECDQMNLDKIAYNIKFFREKNGWTQEVLAEKVVSSRSTIAKWENNSTTPDITSLIKLSDLFGISIDHLVGRHSFQDDLLKEFKRIYSTNKPFDEDLIELTEYLMTNPKLKQQFYRLKNYPIHKQLSIHRILQHIIDEFEKL